MKRNFKLFTALAILLLVFSSMSVLASLEKPSKPDVIVASEEADSGFYTYFPDIVNIPAEACENQPNGKLLLVYYRAQQHGSKNDAQSLVSSLEMVESTDDGKTWESKGAIVDQAKLQAWGISSPEKPVEAHDPNLDILPDNTIVFTFWTSTANNASDINTYIMDSRDGGETWSDPIKIPCSHLTYGACKHGDSAIFPDSSNQILIPLYGRADGSESGMDTDVVLVLATKTANGWSFDNEYVFLESDVSNGITYNEVSLVAVSSNTIYALSREPGHLFKSTDKGITWTQIADDNSKNTQQPRTVLLPDGSIFFVWSVHGNNGRPVYGKLFRPEYGWDNIPPRMIYISPRNNSDIADPAPVFTNDGKLFVAYYDSQERYIGGTFTELSDWEVPEIDMNFESRTILHTEDTESGTVGKAFNSSYFYKVGTGATAGINVAEIDGNKVIDFYDLSSAGYPRLMSNATITGNYTVTFDAYFTTFESAYMNFTSAEGGPTFQIDGSTVKVGYQGVIKTTKDLALQTETWYKMKFSRIGNSVFAKVWTGEEPTEWTLKYTLPADVVENQMRFSYYSGASNSHFYVDDIAITRAMEIQVKDTLEVMDGTTDTLTYEIFPAPIEDITVTFTSSDTSVATVTSAGIITPHKAGETTITLSGAGMTAECKVTVVEQKLEASNKGEQIVFWEENLEDNELGTFTTNDFSQYITADRAAATVVEENGNKILRINAELVTGVFHYVSLFGYKSIADDYTLTADFRFNSKTVNVPDGGQTIMFGVQHATGNYLMNVKTDKVTFSDNSGKVQCELAKEHTPGIWYTARISRAGNVIYGRTWVKGDPEPNTWDVLYTGIDIGKAGTMRVTYQSASTGYYGGSQSADFDNIYASRRAEVSINDTYISGRAGESVLLKGVVTPDVLSKTPAITAGWYSDNEDIATVTATGRVTFVAPGTTKVNYKVGLKTVKSCTVEVSKGYKPYINKAATTGKVGMSETMFVVHVPAIEGSSSVNWNSGDSTVATIDQNGKLTYIKEGITYITATTDYGTAICAVQVIADEVGTRVVSVEPKSVRATVGGKSVKLSAAITPADDTATISWSSADTSIVAVDPYGNLTFNGEGITYITATTIYGYAICPVVVESLPEISIEGNTLIIENYISGVTYAYTDTPNALDSWTTFTTQRVSLPKANTLYYVKVAATEGNAESVTVEAPEKTDGITFKGASLVLDGSIGMKLYFDIDTEVTDLENTRLTYTAIGEGSSGDTTFEIGEDGRTATVMLYTPAKNMPTTYWETSLVWADKNGNTTDMGSLAENLGIYSYITSLKNLAATGNKDALAALDTVEAMETYCLYAESFFLSDTALENVTADVTEDAPASKSGAIDGINHYQTSLILEEKTSIRHYFKVTDETVPGTLEISTDGGTLEYDKEIKNNGDVSYITVDIADIPAQDLGTQYTLTLKSGDSTATVTYSATNYMAKTSNGESKLANLSKTLFNYFEEAKAYKEYLDHRDDIESDSDETNPDQW